MEESEARDLLIQAMAEIIEEGKTDQKIIPRLRTKVPGATRPQIRRFLKDLAKETQR